MKMALVQIDNVMCLVVLPPDAIEVDPGMVEKLHTNAEQREHCTSQCPINHICATMAAYQTERALLN